ncbi:MAG: hypothetical protein FWD80_05305, partial [Propionibacteriaceae bacterium]|nr:hypothetical protein [Propionibacteriaceae bacterium]
MTIRRRLFAAPLLAIGLLLSACTPTEPPLPDATANAQALANALISGDLGSLPFVDSVSAAVNEYKVVTAGLGGVHPSVEVTDIAYDQQAQVAKVSYSQTYVFGQQWQFPSFATFHYAGSDGWQLIWTPSIVQPALDGWTRLTVSRTAATRGQIIGDDGTPIVYNRDVYKVGIDKANLPADQQDAAARALAKIVGVNADNFAKAVANAGPQQFVVAITFRADQLPDITSVPGALAQPSKLPLAPTKTFAIGLLGTAGEATAEDIDNGGGAVQAGDMVGKSGLQASQNAALSGTPGYTVYLAPRADADVVLPTPAPSSSAQPTPSITDKQVIF